ESGFTRINDNAGQAAGSTSKVFFGGIAGAMMGAPNDIVRINTVTGQLGTVLPSSARFKKDINPMDKASEPILALRPVTFHYKEDSTNKLQFGLIAEEVAKVDPSLVVLDQEGKPLSVRYEQINAMLLNEFLKEHKKVEEHQAKIADLNSRVAKQEATIAQQQKGMDVLTAQLKEQATQIQKVSAQLEVSKPTAHAVANNQ